MHLPECRASRPPTHVHLKQEVEVQITLVKSVQNQTGSRATFMRLTTKRGGNNRLYQRSANCSLISESMSSGLVAPSEMSMARKAFPPSGCMA